VYPYNTLINQMAEVTVSKPEDQDYLRKVFSTLPKRNLYISWPKPLCACMKSQATSSPNPSCSWSATTTPPKHSQSCPFFAKHEPNCTYVVIPNAKHGAHMDAPEFFHNKLFDYLEKHAR
jgi:hypothetical protein